MEYYKIFLIVVINVNPFGPMKICKTELSRIIHLDVEIQNLRCSSVMYLVTIKILQIFTISTISM